MNSKTLILNGLLGKTLFIASNRLTKDEFVQICKQFKIAKSRVPKLLKLQSLLETFPRLYHSTLDVSVFFKNGAIIKRFLCDDTNIEMKKFFRSPIKEPLPTLCYICDGVLIEGICELCN